MELWLKPNGIRLEGMNDAKSLLRRTEALGGEMAGCLGRSGIFESTGSILNDEL